MLTFFLKKSLGKKPLGKHEGIKIKSVHELEYLFVITARDKGRRK